MKIFGRGIRRRLAPMLTSTSKLKLALSLLCSMPGAPLLIYGDEIGMGDNLGLEGRNAVRTPMQWSATPQGGFSTAPNSSLPLPSIDSGPFGYARVNVADQKQDPNSLLNWTTQLLQVRRQCPEWGAGTVHIFETTEPSVLGHQAEWQGHRVMALHNLAGKACSVELNHMGDNALLSLLSSNSESPTPESGRTVHMESYGYRWFRLQPSQS